MLILRPEQSNQRITICAAILLPSSSFLFPILSFWKIFLHYAVPDLKWAWIGNEKCKLRNCKNNERCPSTKDSLHCNEATCAWVMVAPFDYFRSCCLFFALSFISKVAKKEMTHENSIGFGVEWCACDTAHMRFANKYPIQTPIIYL